MAGPLNHARVQMSKIFNGEPRSYTRFNIEQDTDCDDIQVEIKHSDESEGEVVSSFSPPQRSYIKIVVVILVFVVIFLGGYLVGYVTHGKPKPEAVQLLKSEGNETASEYNDPPEPFLDWSNIKDMLQERLLRASFTKTLGNFSVGNHEAGSNGDEVLASRVLEEFNKLGMNPWYDTHFVKLQVPSREDPNKVLLGNEEIGRPKGYLAYSATGTKQGKVIYANYGEKTDLQVLRNAGVNLTGSVALIRTGVISLAEKVANAAKFGVVAVLIYQEPGNGVEINTELFGHVHLGTGDPYTPGFPSFNHTQFPPSESSGLPKILAQTITAEMAIKIHKKMGGQVAPENFVTNLGLGKYTLGGETDVSVSVKNILVDTKINNVFGVIKGLVDPDRYVVLGAQRDAFSNGFAKSTVGTCLLVELARALSRMVKDGFKPKRSIVFASWSAGDYGSVGSTEWLEGYLSSLNKKAFTYISLDGTILGAQQFKASASPLLHNLLRATLNEVKIPVDFKNTFLEPMKMEDGAYPFLAFSGIPSVSFRFVSDGEVPVYKPWGTPLDTEEKLKSITNQRFLELFISAAQVAGQMTLRLVHDHILRLDVTSYTQVIRKHVANIKNQLRKHSQNGVVSTDSSPLSTTWLSKASGSYSRAASSLVREIKNSDLMDTQKCRDINDRIMRVEHNLLSPYVSPKDTPFRHIFFGSGTCTIRALIDHLQDLKNQTEGSDADLFHNQFALATWTIQGCANDLTGDIWSLDNQID